MTSAMRASGRSTLLMTRMTGRFASRVLRSTNRVCGSGPSLASTSSTTPSTMDRPRSTSPPKSARPGVSTMLMVSPLCGTAGRARSLMDRTFTLLALIFYSMPTFVLGLLLLLVFYYELTIHGIHAFPGSGYTSFTTSPWHWFRGLVLPWITLSLVSAATYPRLTRGSMLDVLGEDYIRTARAKGMPERRVIFRHALRAALTPVVTQYGIDVGVLLGGAIITEQVFGMPGLGFTAVQAINQQDLPVVIGVVIVAAAAVVAANLLLDALYAVLAPRVRLH